MANTQAVSEYPLYVLNINDGGADGGSSSHITVADLPSSIDTEALEGAIRTFGDAIASIGTYEVRSITRQVVTQTVL